MPDLSIAMMLATVTISDFLQVLLVLQLAGHLGIWCTVFNQVHATGWPRFTRKTCERLVYVAVILLGTALCARHFTDSLESSITLWTYSWLCLTSIILLSSRWLARKLRPTKVAELEFEQTEHLNLADRLPATSFHGWQARLLSLVPFNQSLSLSVEQRFIRVEDWPDSLNGMKIAHISDLHLNGKIDIAYFQQVIEICNQANPDFVFLTGDVVDKVKCLNWLPDVLGRVKSRCGSFYILGNHDDRIPNEQELRTGIQACGFRRADGNWQPVIFNQTRFMIAGDELPWFRGGECISECPEPSILLAHSPDRIITASKKKIDLVLAGHCHGGQIRIPVIGPLIAPSRFGVRFASGTFKIGHTLLHVTRGISSDDPIRLNCPPELNLLTVIAGPASHSR